MIVNLTTCILVLGSVPTDIGRLIMPKVGVAFLEKPMIGSGQGSRSEVFKSIFAHVELYKMSQEPHVLASNLHTSAPLILAKIMRALS